MMSHTDTYKLFVNKGRYCEISQTHRLIVLMLNMIYLDRSVRSNHLILHLVIPKVALSQVSQQVVIDNLRQSKI